MTSTTKRPEIVLSTAMEILALLRSKGLSLSEAHSSLNAADTSLPATSGGDWPLYVPDVKAENDQKMQPPSGAFSSLLGEQRKQ